MTFNCRSIVGIGGPSGEIRLGRILARGCEMYTSKSDPFGMTTGVAPSCTKGITPNPFRASNVIAYNSPKVYGEVYDFSKRTAVYSRLTSIRKNGGVSSACAGATTVANRASTGFELGIWHNF